MRKIGFSILASLLLVSGAFAQQTIVVTNNTGNERKGEIVELNVSAIKASFGTKSYVLKDSRNKEVAYQLIKDENKTPLFLIFQADVKANSTVSYFLKEGKPAVVKPKTFARFVPERKDDFAWENDMAAYRMYGPALAKENPSNGVDYWAKCTDELVVDQRYKDDIYNEISYHVDHGKGLDFYKVAHTLGCGGIAPFAAGKLWVGDHFSSYKIIEVGLLRSTFKLVYDSVKVGNTFYKEEITITSNAGSLLNKAEVKYIGADQKMQLAAGIYLHEGQGILNQNAANGTIAYAENAFSDAKVPSGRDYIGVFIPEKRCNVTKDADHALIMADYKTGDSFTYYFGAGWSKWHYATDADWFKALTRFAENTRKPLVVKLK